MTVDELKILITAETAGLEKEIKQDKSQLGSMEKSVAKSANRIKNSFKNLFAGISFTAILYGLAQVGKEAVKLASNLEEVENVVNVTFGSMAYQINEFAETAIMAFGISELTYKQMASTFMAMSNGMGIALEKGLEMATVLTGLAGDMASFYNVSVDVANTALQSVFTGETESLKKFGIVLTEANLQAFALSRGITKSYSSMSQAEKVALRYAYVLQATSQAQGDFARTSGSWANQVRILKEQWSQLLSIIGSGLIAVLTPVVKLLNQILSFLIMIGNSIAKVFGGKGISQASTSTTTAGLGDVSSGLEDVGDSASSAQKQAEKLQRTLMGFDELNTLAPKAENQDLGGSGIGGAGGGDATIIPEITETQEEGQLGKLQEFFDKAKAIVEKWFSDLPKLEFNFDSEKALQDLEQIGLNILNTVAGWGSLVIDIGINVLNDIDIGKLANQVISLTRAFTGLTSQITDALVPAFKDFYDIALSDFVKKCGEVIDGALQHLIDTFDDWASWFEENGVEIQKWIELVGSVLGPFIEKIGTAIELVLDICERLSTFLREIFQAILEWHLSLVDLYEQDLVILQDIGDLLESVFKGDWEGIMASWEKLGKDTAKRQETYFNNVGKLFRKVWDNSVSFVRGLIKDFVKKFEDTLSITLESLGIDVEKFWKNFDDGCELIKRAWNLLVSELGKIVDKIKDTVSTKWDNIKSKVKSKCDELVNDVVKKWEELKNKIRTTIESIKTTVTSIWDNIVNKLKNGFRDGVSNVSGSANNLYNIVTSKIRNIYNTISPIVNTIKNLISGIISVAQNVASTVGGIVSNIWNSIRNVENAGNNVQVQVQTTTNTSSSGNRVGGSGGAVSNRVVMVRANGGFVDRGQLFIANEAGPELVGRIGTQSAVANQNQIIEGIKQGVMSAILETSFSSGKDQNINLYLDSQLVAKKVIKYHNDTVRQTGLSPLML